MDYHNLKRYELIQLVREYKKSIETLKEKQLIYDYIFEAFPYSYIKFNKNGIIKSGDFNLAKTNLNIQTYNSIKEIRTIQNKSLEDYFHIWLKEGKDQTIRIESKLTQYTYKCSFKKENNNSYICIFTDISELSNLQRQYEISESKFRQIFDDLKIGVSILDRNLQIVFANKKMKEYFPNIIENAGLICYKTYNKPPRNEPCSYCPCIKTLADGEIHETITETPADNLIRYFLLRSSPIKDKNNDILYIIELVEDISDRIKVEQSINFQNSFLKHLIDSIPVGIFYKDINLKYIGCNKRYAEYFNLSPEEIIGKTATDLYSPEDANKFQLLDTELIKTGKIQTLEFKSKNLKTGKLDFFLLHNSPFYDQEKKIRGIIGILIDITELKNIGHKLQESYELINELIDQTNSLVISLDLEGNIIIFNKAAEKITGYNREEVLGKNWFHIFVPAKKYPELYNLYKIFSKRKTIIKEYYENFILTKSGEEKLIRWQNYLQKKDNKVVGVTSIGLDITEIIKKEATINKLTKLIDNIPQPLLIMDRKFKIEYINSAYTSLTGYKNKDLIGNTFNIYKAEEANKKTYAEMMQAIKNDNSWSGEFLSQKKNGQLYYEIIHIFPIKDEKGINLNYVVVKTNSDEIKTIKLELQNLKYENKELSIYNHLINKALNDFLKLYNDNLIPNFKLIKEKSTNNLDLKYFRNIEIETKKISDFIKFTKELSERPQRNLEYQNTDLNKLIQNIHNKFKENYDIDNIKLFSTKKEEKTFLNTDKILLQQIIESLLITATEIIGKGTIRIQIQKSILNKRVNTSLKIIGKSDNNIENKLMLLKNALVNTELNNIGEFPDISLKLFILEKVLKKLNSKLKIEILNNKEFKFIILFLLSKEELLIHDTKQKTKKVFIIEDNLSNIEIIKLFLLDKLSVEGATTLKDSLHKVKQDKYDILFIDIDLGNETDGIQILKELRKLNKYKNTPFIAVTGYAQYSDKEKLLESGFTDYLAKPFRKEQLIELINKYI